MTSQREVFQQRSEKVGLDTERLEQTLTTIRQQQRQIRDNLETTQDRIALIDKNERLTQIHWMKTKNKKKLSAKKTKTNAQETHLQNNDPDPDLSSSST